MIDVDIEQRLGAFDLDVAFRDRGADRRRSSDARASGKTSWSTRSPARRPASRSRHRQRRDAVRQCARHRPRRRNGVASATCSRTICSFRTWTSNRTCCMAIAARRLERASSSQRRSSTCSDSRRCSIAAAMRSPAASGSAWRSAARCWRSRACCSWTSRSHRSTRAPQARCCATSSSCATSSAMPIVYVSHSVEEVTRLADTLVLLADGKAVARAASTR